MSLVPAEESAHSVPAVVTQQETSPPVGSSGPPPPAGHVPTHYEQNLQGILNFAISQTDGSAPNPDAQSAETMDPERKRFLEEFLESLRGRDHMSAVTESLTVVLDSSATEAQKIDALEVIADEVEDINVAADFITVKGIVPTKALLASGNPEYQWRAAAIVANMTQNHPKCQSAAFNFDLLSSLVPLLAPGQPDLVRLKSLTAMSSMIRGSEENFKQFCSHETALPSVLACLSEGEPSERLMVKTIVFLRHLLRGQKKHGEGVPGDSLPSARLLQIDTLLKITAALTASETRTSAGSSSVGTASQIWEHGLTLLCDLHLENEHLVTKLREEIVPFVDAVTQRHEKIAGLEGEDHDAHLEEIAAYKKLFG